MYTSSTSSFSTVPSGKPTITAAHNTSSTSIQLSWRPPPQAQIHGEFLGYRIAYRPRNGEDGDKDSAAIREIEVKDPAVNKYTIQKLAIFTQYLVSLQVRNPAGLGPSTTVVVMTDEGCKWFIERSVQLAAFDL